MVVSVVGTMARLELVIGNWAGAFVCAKMYKQSSYLPCAAGIRQLGEKKRLKLKGFRFNHSMLYTSLHKFC